MSETPHTLSTIREADPGQIIATVNNVAGACRLIVGASAMKIQGRSYIKVEGWQAIAAAHGCTASADSVTAVEGGIAATATIRRLTDGAILGQAEGFVGDDENMWAKRPMYARRAMAQTRAISRACRSAFAHVVVAMNAGHGTDYSTTPAEEVPPEGFDDRRRHHAEAEQVQTAPAAPAASVAPARPKWTDPQKAEYAQLKAAIVECGGADRLKEVQNAHANNPAHQTLDAMRHLLETLEAGG